MIIKSQCIKCIHFNRKEAEAGNDYSCTAFERIPEEIYINKFDHHYEYKGDHGIRFDPIRKADQEYNDIQKFSFAIEDIIDKFSISFEESKHPRGQPKNQGQFASKGSSGHAAQGHSSSGQQGKPVDATSFLDTPGTSPKKEQSKQKVESLNKDTISVLPKDESAQAPQGLSDKGKISSAGSQSQPPQINYPKYRTASSVAALRRRKPTKAIDEGHSKLRKRFSTERKELADKLHEERKELKIDQLREKWDLQKDHKAEARKLEKRKTRMIEKLNDLLPNESKSRSYRYDNKLADIDVHFEVQNDKMVDTQKFEMDELRDKQRADKRELIKDQKDKIKDLLYGHREEEAKYLQNYRQVRDLDRNMLKRRKGLDTKELEYFILGAKTAFDDFVKFTY